jgi:hypothetical protein
MNRFGRTCWWFIGCVSMTLLCPLSSRAQPESKNFSLIQIRRGENTWIGRYDGDGNFIPDPQYRANYGRYGGGGGLAYVSFGTVINSTSRRYEYRSGYLISGAIIKSGIFVPDIGSKILEYKKDYDLKSPDRMIWNKHETVAAFWTVERKKQFPQGLPNDPEPAVAGTPSEWVFTPFSKSHPKKPPKHARAIGDVVEFGYLSDEGEFIPDPDLPLVSRTGILGPISSDAWAVPRYYTLPRLDKDQKVRSLPTYEYRSGRLIRGDLHENGNFVPELGSTVIDFKDFDPDKEPRRWIYNLPGELKRKSP